MPDLPAVGIQKAVVPRIGRTPRKISIHQQFPSHCILPANHLHQKPVRIPHSRQRIHHPVRLTLGRQHRPGRNALRPLLHRIPQIRQQFLVRPLHHRRDRPALPREYQGRRHRGHDRERRKPGPQKHESHRGVLNPPGKPVISATG